MKGVMVRVISLALAVLFALATVMPAAASVHERPAGEHEHAGHAPNVQADDDCGNDCHPSGTKLCCPIYAGGCGASYVGVADRDQELPSTVGEAYFHRTSSQLVGRLPDAELPPPRA